MGEAYSIKSAPTMDEDSSSPLRSAADSVDFTGFIFGNVDEKGNLEGDCILNKVPNRCYFG